MTALMQTPDGGRPKPDTVSRPIHCDSDREAAEQIARETQRGPVQRSVLSETGQLVDWRAALAREVGP